MKTKKYSCAVLFFLLSLTACNEISAQLYWNKAGTFAGNSASYVSVPNSDVLNITESFTLEAWINPVLSGAASKGIISKGGIFGTSLRYGMRLTVTGRITLSINGSQRLITKSSTVIQDSMWTHVCATFSHLTNTHSIYINGMLDTSAVFAGTLPSSNTDSLFIGISGNSTPFTGQLDEVRVWERELSSSEVGTYYRTSLGTSTGIYSGLALSITFQKQNNNSPFTFRDFSDYFNHGNGRNVSEYDMTNKPYHTISTNESILLDGIDDYASGKDDALSFPNSDMTFETWIYPKDGNLSLIFKKRAGASVAFSISVSATEIRTTLSNHNNLAVTPVPINRWNHIAASYKSNFGLLSVYLNGNLVGNHFAQPNAILSSNDSIFIGGAPGTLEFFNGYIDEVRIIGASGNVQSIRNLMYTGLEDIDGADLFTSLTNYKFDGNTLDCGNGGSPKLSLRNNARFSHPSTLSEIPRSPLMKGEDESYQSSYYFRTSDMRIPSAGTLGNTLSGYATNLNYTINDIDVYVLLNHTNLSNIKITFSKSQTPDSIVIFDGSVSGSTDQNIALIFDDDADSSLKSNIYASFCSPIKPLNNLEAMFNGKSTLGFWNLRISDAVTGDTGFLYSWGIKFNNMESPEANLSVFSFAEGFYNQTTNFTVRDTMTAELRSPTSPYFIVGSSTRFSSNAGQFNMSYPISQFGNTYYIVMKHRNSIETWSSLPFTFIDRFGVIYNFQNLISLAYGNNMTQVDFSPEKFALFGGDVNQDGTIDLSDGSLIDNDAFNFASGYLPTDVNGDEVIDLADAVFADNNGFNFVGKITP